MKHLFKKEDAPQDRSTKTVKILGTEEFLDKSKGGYWDTPSDFLNWGESLRPADANELDKTFGYMHANLKCIKESEIKTDKGNRPYKFYTFNRSAKSQPGVKVILEGPMTKVMDDYQDGVLEINFNLQELIVYAQSV